MASLKPLSAKALACARLPSAGALRSSSRILAAPPLSRSAAGRAQATSRVVQAATSPRMSFARAKVHAAQSIARRPEPTEAATEPKLKVLLKSIGAKVANLLKPKPAPLQPLATYILPDGVLSPEADPSSSSGLARLKALGLRLHSRFSIWVDQVVYECKELRDLIRYGPSRGRLPAPALTPQQVALALAQEEEVFRLSDTPPVPRTVAALAGPLPPRRGSRLAALLRRLLRQAAALLTPRKAAAAQRPSTTSSTSAGASSAAAEPAAGAGAAEVLDTSPSLPVSLHASTANESDTPFAATTAPVAAAAHEIADDDDWVRRVWARAAAAAAADAGSTGSSTAGSSRRQSFVSGSSCEPAAAAVGSSRNNTSSGGLSASDSAGTATSASADMVTAADYALVEPAGADEVDEEEEADGSSSNNEDTTHYSQLARYASSSSSSAPSDDDSESGGENVEDTGSRRHQKQGRLAAMSGKAGHGARVGAWVAASRAAAGSGGLKQQRRRQAVAVAASGYQLVKMARPATAAVYDEGLMG
ncbi:hypothetical protein CHLRE_14g623600v5 [Chlamydomonas reinhardtii]|uniref:Uncharacterized protein n=1 Tax=Chlamydomonas reinhardtii TaxID=3055 RepID=A8IUI2_CHLRE|nr:uncharacterized protein CHLRE_14g623600v5 [Chlamydomonas reinhardtii]PNW73220.1 hypothetical protein CHLRE_14g623600v5 [Chlamydomonas reinhardtii]|eukprot:XP_001692831.1 predicted protein [Chlamydomonas reinhardtii]